MNPINDRRLDLKAGGAKTVAALRRLGARFRENRSGIAAAEFALVLPFLLLAYFGTVEISQGMILNRKVTLAASTIGNIVSQYTTISASSQLPDILQATNQIFTPYSTSNASVLVTCITIDSSGKATVAWSQGLNATVRSGSISVPAALDVANTTVILSESSYAFTAPFDFLHMGTINLYSPVYMNPRASTTINLVS